MKLAYRIVTPILAAGTILMAIFLKMFSFTWSIALSETAKPMGSTLAYSIVEAISKLAGTGSADEAAAAKLLETLKPAMPSIIAFFVFLIIALVLLVAIMTVGALSDKKKIVIILSAAGLVSLFVCILTSNKAFGLMTDGETIDLGTIVSSFGGEGILSTLAPLAIKLMKISASLGSAFYAIAGMFILLILWCVLSAYLIKSPIHFSKKNYRRSKPLRSPFVKKGAKGGE